MIYRTRYLCLAAALVAIASLSLWLSGCDTMRQAASDAVGAPSPREIDSSRSEYRLAAERREDAAEALQSLPADAPEAVRSAAEASLADAEEALDVARERAVAVESATVAAVERLKQGGTMIGDGLAPFSPQGGAIARMIAEYGSEALLALLLGGTSVVQTVRQRNTAKRLGGARRVLEVTEEVGLKAIATDEGVKAIARARVAADPVASEELNRVRVRAQSAKVRKA